MTPTLAALLAGIATLLVVPDRGLARLARRSEPWRASGHREAPHWRRIVPAAAAAAAVWAVLPGVWGPVVAVGAFALVHHLAGRLLRDRAPEAPRSEAPEALDFLAVCLDAGHPVSSALRVVADVSPPQTAALLRRASANLALGLAGPAAWEALRSDPVWGQVAADVARSERSGAAVADVLRMHADDARRDEADAAVKAARTVGVRSVIPLMACFLPAFLVVGVVPIVAGLVQGFFG